MQLICGKAGIKIHYYAMCLLQEDKRRKAAHNTAVLCSS